MDLPPHIREKIEELIQGKDIKCIKAAALRLSENYRREAHISASEKNELLAYCVMRMPATFGAVSRALELALEEFGEADEISSVLDAGAGTGAAAAAAEIITGCADITCLERSRNMLELGRMFAPNLKWREYDLTNGINEQADLVICSYCLNELPEACRKPVTVSLAKAANKLLVITEPGTPKSFEELKRTREELIGLGMKIIAPCPTNNACPLPEDDWCHFTARIARSKLHKQLKGGEVPYEDEKFCFLAAAWETDEHKPGISRIIRHPIIEPGKITLRLCSEDGVYDKIVTRSSPQFKKARKSNAGDGWQLI